MPTTSTTRSRHRPGLRALALVPLALVGAQACTDLTETPRDALSPNTTFRTPTEINAGLAAAYSQLRPLMWEVYNLNEVTSDEQIVPTRGPDWFDNGRWLEIHRLGFTPASGSALEDINGAWNQLYTGVARTNLIINAVQNNGVTGQERAVAEARVLRAWFYYNLLDMFGGVPLVTTTEIAVRPRNTNIEIFNFIESELNAARTALPATPFRAGDADYGRVTQAAADAILASLYLNAQVYTGTVTATGLTPGQPRWQQAFDAANRVIAGNQFPLAQSAADWSNQFAPGNDGASEHIFVLRNTNQPDLGQNLPMRVLHYNQLNPAPWNGWAIPAEAYERFDAGDARRSVFLEGRGTNITTGTPVNDRAGQPLVFTRRFNETAATEGDGVRLLKFRPIDGAPNGNNPNDFPFFRVAEMYLTRAEAAFRLGRTADALADLNAVRQGKNPTRLTAVTEQAILNERLFELAGEMKRRRDLIRFGRFTGAKQYLPNGAPGYKILFPIPVTQIGSNPQLTQNPGY